MFRKNFSSRIWWQWRWCWCCWCWCCCWLGWFTQPQLYQCFLQATPNAWGSWIKKKISLWINKHIAVYSETLIPHEVLPLPSGHSGDTDISVFLSLILWEHSNQIPLHAHLLTNSATRCPRKMFLRLFHSPLDSTELLYHENKSHNLAENKARYQWHKNHF